MQVSARNRLRGKVLTIRHGAVNTEVLIELEGGEEIVAIITMASAKALALTVGKGVYAVVKASDVMVSVD